MVLPTDEDWELAFLSGWYSLPQGPGGMAVWQRGKRGRPSTGGWRPSFRRLPPAFRGHPESFRRLGGGDPLMQGTSASNLPALVKCPSCGLLQVADPETLRVPASAS
jgi:hypothetical protein